MVAQDQSSLPVWLGWGDLRVLELQAQAGGLPSDGEAHVELRIGLAQTVGECSVGVTQDGTWIGQVDADWPSVGWGLTLPAEALLVSHLELREQGWSCSSTFAQVDAWGVVTSEEEAGRAWVEVGLFELL